jgi:hypothetical protein
MAAGKAPAKVAERLPARATRGTGEGGAIGVCGATEGTMIEGMSSRNL